LKKEEKSLGLYVHIPFCAKKCDYCDFYSLPGMESRIDAYVQALETQIS
jgi:Coproporphyrinogen III oxidase and related Fe-S oxidoreductases